VGSAVAEKLEHLLSRVDGLMYLLRHTCGSHRVRGVSLLYEHTLKFIGCRPPTFGELDTTVTLAIAGTCRRMGLRRVRLWVDYEWIRPEMLLADRYLGTPGLIHQADNVGFAVVLK